MGEARRKKQALERESQEPLSLRRIVRIVSERLEADSDESADRRAAERKRGMHRRAGERFQDGLTRMLASMFVAMVIVGLVIGAFYLVNALAG
jgi:F0F1-type ATP synthase assembly protein I